MVNVKTKRSLRFRPEWYITIVRTLLLDIVSKVSILYLYRNIEIPIYSMYDIERPLFSLHLLYQDLRLFMNMLLTEHRVVRGLGKGGCCAAESRVWRIVCG